MKDKTYNSVLRNVYSFSKTEKNVSKQRFDTSSMTRLQGSHQQPPTLKKR
jgi:hypothetical protein